MFLSNKKEIESLKKHLDIEKKLLQLFEENKDEENKDKNDEIDLDEIVNILNSMKKLRKETVNKFQLSKEKNIEINDKINLVKDKSLDSNLLESYEKVRNELSSICDLLEKDSIPTFNLNIFINFINLFSKMINKEINIEKIEISNQLLFLSEDEKKHNLSLKNGKKIVLSKRNFDLSSFTYDELVEILRFLDLVISDNSYDYLRKEIVLQINSISNVSQIKN